MIRAPKAIPLVLWLGASIASLLLIVPFIGLSQRTPWSTFFQTITEETVLRSITLSLIVATSASVLCFILGLPLGWVLSRGEFRGLRVIRAIVLLPMVLPPVAGGTALLFALGRKGFIGSKLDSWFGLTLPFSTAGAIIAATFVSLPFFVLAIETSANQLDESYEESSLSLGASPTRTFFTTSLPMIKSAIFAGIALSWARALGEFGATITFAGDNPEKTRTLPLQLFVALETNPERAIVLGMLMVVMSLAVLITLRGKWMASQ